MLYALSLHISFHESFADNRLDSLSVTHPKTFVLRMKALQNPMSEYTA